MLFVCSVSLTCLPLLKPIIHPFLPHLWVFAWDGEKNGQGLTWYEVIWMLKSFFCLVLHSVPPIESMVLKIYSSGKEGSLILV